MTPTAEERARAADRDAEREGVRERILEAVRDIVAEEGLDALSMRALAVRVGVSPAAIYMHFADKDELLRGVKEEGFRRLSEAMVLALSSDSPALARLADSGRGYARFALENTGYFRAMFEVPGVARVDACPAGEPGERPDRSPPELLLEEAQAAGEVSLVDVGRTALMAWGLIHGLTSLYLSGHLQGHVGAHEEFMDLIDRAMEDLRAGWKADGS